MAIRRTTEEEVICIQKQMGEKREKAGQVCSEYRTVSESLWQDSSGQSLGLQSIRIHLCEGKTVLGMDRSIEKHLDNLVLKTEWCCQGNGEESLRPRNLWV